eukprot:scaffold2701_cov96-Isochrysis_galbana.AAC.2
MVGRGGGSPLGIGSRGGALLELSAADFGAWERLAARLAAGREAAAGPPALARAGRASGSRWIAGVREILRLTRGGGSPCLASAALLEGWRGEGYFEAWARLAAPLEATGGSSRASSSRAELSVPVGADVRDERAIYFGWRVWRRLALASAALLEAWERLTARLAAGRGGSRAPISSAELAYRLQPVHSMGARFIAAGAWNRQKSQLGSSRFYWEDGNVCVAVGRRNPPRL